MILRTTFLHDVDGLDEDEEIEGPTLSQEQRREAADFLLRMDSGPWSSDSITHHCKGLTCCQNARESKLKIWVAIQALLWDGTSESMVQQ